MTRETDIQREALETAVRDCLNTIVDPCSIAASAPAGLVDMGMVSALTIEDLRGGAHRAVIQIGITHPFCMMAGVFLNEVRQRVPQIAGIAEVEVSLDNETLWTPDRMTPAYRDRLAAVRSPKKDLATLKEK